MARTSQGIEFAPGQVAELAVFDAPLHSPAELSRRRGLATVVAGTTVYRSDESPRRGQATTRLEEVRRSSEKTHGLFRRTLDRLIAPV